MIASPIEIQDYLEKFCTRNSIDQSVLSSIYGGMAPMQGGGNNGMGGYSTGDAYFHGGMSHNDNADNDLLNQLNGLSLNNNPNF
jgi:hypothetical protein